MITKKRYPFFTSLLFLPLFPFFSQADIIGYQFKSIDSNKQQMIEHRHWVDPKDTLDVYLSGGLERYVDLTVLKDGKELYHYQSPLLSGASDISFLGKSFYGAVAKVPKSKLQSCLCTLQFKLLDSSQKVIRQTSKLIKISTKLPIDKSPLKPEIIWKAENINRKVTNDFLFAIDVSGSMREPMVGLRDSLEKFAEKILNTGGNNRYAGLAVSSPFENEEGKFNGKFDFTSDVTAFKNWISDYKLTGSDERMYSAAAWGMKHMQWRDEANKYVVIISDEKPHDGIGGVQIEHPKLGEVDDDLLNNASEGHNIFIFSPHEQYKTADATFIQRNFDAESLLKEVIGKHKPIINRTEVRDGKITVHVIDAFIGVDPNGVQWHVDTAYLELKNKTNKHYKLNVSQIRFIDGTYYLDFDALDQSNFIDGLYEVKVFVKDNLKNEASARLGEFTIDTAGPEIQVQKGSDVFVRGSIKSFDDLNIKVSDDSDFKQATLTAVISGGPENVSRYLETKLEGDYFKVLPPALFKSKKVDDYKLDLTATDVYGNTTRYSTALTYEPEIIRPQDGANNLLQLPAVPGSFKYNDTLELLHTDSIHVDGLPLAGEYAVEVFSSPQSEVGLKIENQILQPNRKISFKYNFDKHHGRFNVPVSAYEQNKAGLVKLVAFIHAPNAPIIEANIKFWDAQAHLNAKSWQIRQVIDPVDIQATPTKSTLCRFTTELKQAKNANIIRDPVCLLEWTHIPDESESLVKDAVPTIKGQAFKLGSQKVAYTLSVFDSHDKKTLIGQGAHDLKVRSAHGALKYTTAKPIKQANHIVDAHDIWLKRLEGFECALTLRKDEALEPDACLLEWTHIPDGLAQQSGTSEPLLTGHMVKKGLNDMTWRISTFSKSGAKVTLAEERYPIDVVTPDAPIIQVLSDYHWRDNIYLVPYDVSSLGDVQIKSLKAPLNLKIFQEQQLVLNQDHAGLSYAYDDFMTIREDLSVSDKPLFEEQTLQVKTYYIELPVVQHQHEVTAIRVPSGDIYPVFIDPPREVLSTDNLSLNVTLRQNGEEYNSKTMGHWHIRLLQEENYRDYIPLTAFKPLEDGQVTFDIDVSDSADSSLSVLAEAKLVHELDGYERVERSYYAKTISIKKGEQITGQVATRYVAGKAPYYARLYVNLTDSDDAYALEQVLWEQSSDKGKSWTVIDDGLRTSLSNTFEAGIHLVRATLVNRYSGASYTTSPLEVTAYHLPEIFIEGPDMDFVGSEIQLTASLSLHKMPVENVDDYVIEWSRNGGKTYKHEEPMVISSDETDDIKIYARVRSKIAPKHDNDSYDVTSKRVSFVDVSPPRLFIDAPRKMEFNKEYTWSIESKVPYKLDYDVNGFFTLPSGEQKNQHVLRYTPNEADVKRSYIDLHFTAWLDKYRSQSETQTSQRISVWKYEWPDFEIALNQNTDTAPATIDVSVKQTTYNATADALDIEWHLPSGAQDVDDSRFKKRSFVMNKEGTYQVSAILRDARGNETTLNESFSVQAAKALQLGFKTRVSDDRYFAPLDVKIYPDVSGGHPRDRITDIDIYIDDELLEYHYGYLKKTFEAGEHRIKIIVHSKMGHSASHEEVIQVVHNQAPVCEPEVEELERYWVIHPNCTDSDGRVRRYHWTVDDEPPFKERGSLELPKRYYPAFPQISFQAEDDFYDKSQVYVIEH